MARPALFAHRKFRRLCSMIGECRALGCLEWIWLSGYESGDPLLGDSEDVELAGKWDGEPGELSSALEKTGFLDKDESGKFSIHDLFDHAPDYVQARMMREAERRKKGKTISDLRRDAALQRWSKTKQLNASESHVNANEPTPAPAPAPAPKTNIARPKGSGGMTEEFITFYKAYPKHEDKQDAWKAWQTLNNKRPPLDLLLAAITKQKEGRKWQEGFIKAPASWLRKGCWEDEPEMTRIQFAPPPPEKPKSCSKCGTRASYRDGMCAPCLEVR